MSPETLVSPPVDEASQQLPPPEATPGATIQPAPGEEGGNTAQPAAEATTPVNESKSDEETVTPEEQQDSEYRYTDIELLGKSFRVRQRIDKTSTGAIKTWQGLKSKVRNTLDTPGKAIKQFAYNRAKSSSAKKEARLKSATSARLYELRQSKLDKANVKLENRESNLNERVERMANRSKTVHENAENRRNEQVAALKERREEALARKTLRQQLRTSGASTLETRSILSELPAEHIARIGKVALIAETSERKLSEADRHKSRAEKHQHNTESRIENMEERAKNSGLTIEQAEKSIEELNLKLIPDAEEQVSLLTSTLSELATDSPNYQQIANQILQAKSIVENYKKQLGFWHNVSSINNQRVEDAKKRLVDLGEKHTKHKEKVATATEHLTKRGEVSKVHKVQLENELHDVLNPQETLKVK